MRLVRLALVVTIAVSAACKKKSAGVARRASAIVDAQGELPSTTPLGPARDPASLAVMAVFYPAAGPRTPPRAVFDAIVAERAGLAVVAELDPSGPLPAVSFQAPSITEFAPPERETLEYQAKDLGKLERDALPDSRSVVVLSFGSSTATASSDLRRAHEIVAELADRTGGVIWSNMTQQAFGATAWQQRADRLAQEPVDATAVFVVQSQAGDSGATRLVTLGLMQLGLPELSLEGIPGTRRDHAGALVNAIAQLLHEGREPSLDGVFEVDANAIRNAAVLAYLKGEAIDELRPITVTLRSVKPQDGDNPGRQWRIEVSGQGTHSERVANALTSMFGSDDEVHRVDRSHPEVQAATKRARARLPELRDAFARGLPAGDQLAVKAPFATSDGKLEFMWIEVHRWAGGTIRGVLLNRPADVPGLVEGSEVVVAEADVHDVIVLHEDGTREGGETDEILQRLQTE